MPHTQLPPFVFPHVTVICYFMVLDSQRISATYVLECNTTKEMWSNPVYIQPTELPLSRKSSFHKTNQTDIK